VRGRRKEFRSPEVRIQKSEFRIQKSGPQLGESVTFRDYPHRNNIILDCYHLNSILPDMPKTARTFKELVVWQKRMNSY